MTAEQHCDRCHFHSTSKPRKAMKMAILKEYAIPLVQGLNESVFGTGLIHALEPIQISSYALVIVKQNAEPSKQDGAPQFAFEEPPRQLKDITYSADEIRIYKPCLTYDDLHGWSNVMARLDNHRIVSEILRTRWG